MSITVRFLFLEGSGKGVNLTGSHPSQRNLAGCMKRIMPLQIVKSAVVFSLGFAAMRSSMMRQLPDSSIVSTGMEAILRECRILCHKPCLHCNQWENECTPEPEHEIKGE